ncbi:unannotated protein [freshwater metagenome]|uniref:Unannotated protein n=1 Tax=freshwater metagenome TaxID=449393 RepID=A0A6J6WHE8_9ZZZZ
MGVAVRIPRPGLCTDNGAMVAALGSLLVTAGATPSQPGFEARSALPVAQVTLA